MNALKQRGLTLIEVLVSLGILASVTVGIVALTNQQSSDTRAAVTALHLKTVGEASNEYIKNNYATITGLATATQPVLIRVSDLIAGGVLNSGFSATNPRGQDTCVLVLQPSPNNLNAMVVTEGGDTIDDLTLGQIAATVGAPGGGIYSTAATTFRGAMGGWSTPVGNFANANHLGQKCNGTAGTIPLDAGHPAMALWFADGDSVSATLYRDAVPGNPTLNTMNTPILMGAGTVQTEGGACTSTGAIGRDASGAVLSCQGGTWKAASAGTYWKDPVNTYASLPIGDPVGAVRTTTDTGRTFMWTGSSWFPIGIDQNGNITIPNTVTAAGGKVTLWNQPTEGGVLQLTGNNGVKMYLENLNGTLRLINDPWNAQIFTLDQNGNMTLGKGDVYTGYLTPGWAVETWGCPSTGAIAKAAYTVSAGWAWDGTLLSCQSGVWRKAQYAGGTGISGILAPLEGMSISCTDNLNYGTYYAKVVGGVLYARATNRWGQGTSWVAGSGVTADAWFRGIPYFSVTVFTSYTAFATLSGLGGQNSQGGTCFTAWPRQ